MSAIEARQAGKRYGRSWALRDCTLSIPSGRVVALVGPNGAGAFLGAILKRTVAAVAATRGSWFAVVFPSVVFLRPLIQKPIVGVASLSGDPGTRWVLDEWLQNSSGKHLNDQQINALLGAQPSAPKAESIDQMLRSHGITHMMRYQPTSRFWHFQLVETAGYGTLTLVLAAATVWWVSRRTS